MPLQQIERFNLSGAHAERKKKLDCVWVTVNYFSRLARRTIILAIAVFLHLHSTVFTVLLGTTLQNKRIFNKQNFKFLSGLKVSKIQRFPSGVNIIFTCLVTLTTCHSLPCLPSSKRFCPLLTIREALDLPIPLLSHHLSSFRHKTHKALTVSLQRERSCSKLFLCLPAPECFRSPPSVVFSPVVSKTNLLWQHRWGQYFFTEKIVA